MSVITSDLLAKIFGQYSLNPLGIHGIEHWLRVHANGLALADKIGGQAIIPVIEYFAVLHDCARFDDGTDARHGERAAELIQGYFSDDIHLNTEEKSILVTAVKNHTWGFMDGNLTVQICWDADRLDLMRVGIRPDPERLCTKAAKSVEMIEWAIKRSRR